MKVSCQIQSMISDHNLEQIQSDRSQLPRDTKKARPGFRTGGVTKAGKVGDSSMPGLGWSALRRHPRVWPDGLSSWHRHELPGQARQCWTHGNGTRSRYDLPGI